MLESIRKHWGWTGLNPVEIVGRNEFGNLLVTDENRAIWRICPEELTCKIIASTPTDFGTLIEDEMFQRDWQMSKLVALARHNLGPLQPGHVYYLVIPACLGGRYDKDNIRQVNLKKLIEVSGNWAFEIKDLPDGAEIQIRVID